MNEKTVEQYQKDIKLAIDTINDLTFLKRLSVVLTIETKNSKQKTQGA